MQLNEKESEGYDYCADNYNGKCSLNDNPYVVGTKDHESWAIGFQTYLDDLNAA